MASSMPRIYTVQYDHNNYKTTTNIIRRTQNRIKSLKAVLKMVGQG